MGSSGGAALKWSVEQRLGFIEFRLYWEGRVNRGDLEERFGISTNQASFDMRRYLALRPDAMVYSRSERTYRPTEAFRPFLGGDDPARYLAEIRARAEGVMGPDEGHISAPPPYDVTPTPARLVEGPVLRAVVASIRELHGLDILYQSMRAETPEARGIEPHALVYDGFRWHARALCVRDGVFKDFVLGRIHAVSGRRERLSIAADDRAWNQFLELDIRPHPGLNPAQAAAIARDYAMTDGKLVLTVRRALLFYALKRFGLDADAASRPPERQHIVLANPEVADTPPLE